MLLHDDLKQGSRLVDFVLLIFVSVTINKMLRKIGKKKSCIPSKNTNSLYVELIFPKNNLHI